MWKDGAVVASGTGSNGLQIQLHPLDIYEVWQLLFLNSRKQLRQLICLLMMLQER